MMVDTDICIVLTINEHSSSANAIVLLPLFPTSSLRRINQSTYAHTESVHEHSALKLLNLEERQLLKCTSYSTQITAHIIVYTKTPKHIFINTHSYTNKFNTPTFNDEWPEFTVQLSISEQTRRMIVLTATNIPPQKQHVDVKSTCAQDFNTLKGSMPSCTTICRVALNKDVDTSKLDDVPTVIKRNCTSCPSRMMTQQFDDSLTVERARDRGCRVTQDVTSLQRESEDH
eukprot:scaffold4240_cov212-Alexandrium_tamarense.AAC.2